MKFILFLALFFTAFTHPAEAAGKYGMNDVSILFPLPKSGNERAQFGINANSKIMNGTLLPKAITKQVDIPFPMIDLFSDIRNDTVYETLTVVGLRLDPCFRQKFTDTCQPQARFILQPEDPSSATTIDAAVHVFYDIDEATLMETLQALRAYREHHISDEASLSLPLGINPVLAREGLTGEYFQILKNTLLAKLSTKQLARVGLFIPETSLVEWVFRSYDVKDGQITPVAIPDVADPTHLILESAAPLEGQEFLSPLHLLPAAKPGTDQLFNFLNDSYTFKENPSPLKWNQLYLSMGRIEDPHSHLAGTIDCVSCHSTPAIKQSLLPANEKTAQNESNFPSKSLPRAAFVNATHSKSDKLTFRLFGYKGADPVIGDRVFNESAIIADFLNQ